MKRIAVIGCGGAGKSYFSRQLSEATGIPVYHLDRMFWSEGWVERPQEDYLREQQSVVEKDEWIIDGNYMSTMDRRLSRADTVVYLDFPTYKCLYGIFSRYFKYWNRSRPDMPEGNPEKIEFEFFVFVLTFRSLRRPRVFKLLSEYRDSTKQYIFTSRKQLNAFLESIQK